MLRQRHEPECRSRYFIALVRYNTHLYWTANPKSGNKVWPHRATVTSTFAVPVPVPILDMSIANRVGLSGYRNLTHVTCENAATTCRQFKHGYVGSNLEIRARLHPCVLHSTYLIRTREMSIRHTNQTAWESAVDQIFVLR